MAEGVVTPASGAIEHAAVGPLWQVDARIEVATAIGVAVAAFAYYVYLIHAFPTIYWYDAIMRYAYPDDLTVDRWLPGSQVIVVVMRQISADAMPMRVALALVSCGTLLATWAFTRRISTPLAGLIAMVALSTNLMFTTLATVPYGEVLFMGGVLGAFTLLDKPKTDAQLYAGTLCLIAACMTRYELVPCCHPGRRAPLRFPPRRARPEDNPVLRYGRHAHCSLARLW